MVNSFHESQVQLTVKLFSRERCDETSMLQTSDKQDLSYLARLERDFHNSNDTSRVASVLGNEAKKPFLGPVTGLRSNH